MVNPYNRMTYRDLIDNSRRRNSYIDLQQKLQKKIFNSDAHITQINVTEVNELSEGQGINEATVENIIVQEENNTSNPENSTSIQELNTNYDALPVVPIKVLEEVCSRYLPL